MYEAQKAHTEPQSCGPGTTSLRPCATCRCDRELSGSRPLGTFVSSWGSIFPGPFGFKALVCPRLAAEFGVGSAHVRCRWQCFTFVSSRKDLQDQQRTTYSNKYLTIKSAAGVVKGSLTLLSAGKYSFLVSHGSCSTSIRLTNEALLQDP